MSLTRRQFLQALGITAALPLIEPLARFAALPDDALLARMFQTHNGLLQDSVHPILEVSDTGYQLPSGWIDRTLAQPILARDYRPPVSITPDLQLHRGDWVQVAAPSAVRYDSPNVGVEWDAMGHGGAARILDILPPATPSDVMWIAMESLMGKTLWSQAHLWRPLIAASPEPDPERCAVIDLNALTVTAYRGSRPVFTSPIASGSKESLKNRFFPVMSHQPAFYNGSPYGLNFPEQAVCIQGTWEHNLFGLPRNVPSNIIELPIYAARALYEFLPDGAKIRVM